MKSVNQFGLTAVVVLSLSGPALAQTAATPGAKPAPAATPANAVAIASAPAPAPVSAVSTPAPAPTPAAAAVASPAPAITLTAAAAAAAPAPDAETRCHTRSHQLPLGDVRRRLPPAVCRGAARSNGYSPFNVTRGYLNIQARLSDRVKIRFTRDMRPTTDANLDRNLALRLEYASLDVQMSDNVAIMSAAQMPSARPTRNRQPLPRARGIARERLGLLPARPPRREHRATRRSADIHVGVFKRGGIRTRRSRRDTSIDGRATFRPFARRERIEQSDHLGVSTSTTAAYAEDRPATWPSGWPPTKATTSRPGAVSVRHGQPVCRRGRAATRHVVPRRSAAGLHGMGRGGRSGPVRSGCGERQRPETPHGVRRRALGSGGTCAAGPRDPLEHEQSVNSQLLSRRLLAQTHIEF